MKISESNIAMVSLHEKEITYSKSELLQEWRNGNAEPGVNPSANNLPAFIQDQLELSAEAKKALGEKNCQNVNDIATEKDLYWISDEDQRKIDLLEELLSFLLGRKVKIHLPKMKLEQPNIDNINIKSKNPPAPQGWGFIFERHESYRETERLTFAAQGVIKTSDGKEINFQTQLSMSREFAAANSISIKGGDALIDPLVINFNGTAGDLTDVKYSFDLDSDGTEEQISFLKEGSGFLALDLNNDGTVNNGSELFGPSSGNGFEELAQYDTDQNGWIDESDAVFDKLRIWTKDSNGKDVLFALGQKGIGAIFLGNISAGFSLNNNENQTLGQAQKAGIFVKEDGTVGTVQQIDLTV